MTPITIQLDEKVAERLRARASAEGRESLEALLGELAEREADLDGQRLECLHGLIREGYASPRRPLSAGEVSQRAETLEQRVLESNRDTV